MRSSQEVAGGCIGFVEANLEPDHRVEMVAFIIDELDAVLTGFRSASDFTAALLGGAVGALASKGAPPMRTGLQAISTNPGAC